MNKSNSWAFKLLFFAVILAISYLFYVQSARAVFGDEDNSCCLVTITRSNPICVDSTEGKEVCRLTSTDECRRFQAQGKGRLLEPAGTSCSAFDVCRVPGYCITASGSCEKDSNLFKCNSENLCFSTTLDPRYCQEGGLTSEDPDATAVAIQVQQGAADETTTGKTFEGFIPQFTIPGSEFIKGEPIKVDATLVGRYIKAIYQFVVGLVVLLSVVMMMYAGYKWILAAGNASAIGSAKQTIAGALAGLVLALGSYIILSVINPQLVELPSLSPQKIETITFNLETTSDYNTEGGSETLPPPRGSTDLVAIPKIDGITQLCANPEERFCTEQCVNALKSVAATMKAAGYTFRLTSCYRSKEKQLSMKGNSMACQCKNAQCSNCPHVSGYAVDAHCDQEKITWQQKRASGQACRGKAECKSKSMTRGDYKCQNVLADAMRRAGMCKLYFEDWHFQPRGTSPQSCF